MEPLLWNVNNRRRVYTFFLTSIRLVLWGIDLYWICLLAVPDFQTTHIDLNYVEQEKVFKKNAQPYSVVGEAEALLVPETVSVLSEDLILVSVALVSQKVVLSDDFVFVREAVVEAHIGKMTATQTNFPDEYLMVLQQSINTVFYIKINWNGFHPELESPPVTAIFTYKISTSSGEQSTIIQTTRRYKLAYNQGSTLNIGMVTFALSPDGKLTPFLKYN